MLSNTGIAEVDMTNVTVAVYYGGLTKVASVHIMGTIMGVHDDMGFK